MPREEKSFGGLNVWIGAGLTLTVLGFWAQAVVMITENAAVSKSRTIGPMVSVLIRLQRNFTEISMGFTLTYCRKAFFDGPYPCFGISLLLFLQFQYLRFGVQYKPFIAQFFIDGPKEVLLVFKVFEQVILKC